MINCPQIRDHAYGIRNYVGEVINSITGQLWCSTNERDALGNNLVPDYVTSVKEGGSYGWPWFFMGEHQDPRLMGTHPELKSKVLLGNFDRTVVVYWSRDPPKPFTTMKTQANSPPDGILARTGRVRLPC